MTNAHQRVLWLNQEKTNVRNHTSCSLEILLLLLKGIVFFNTSTQIAKPYASKENHSDSIISGTQI